MQIYYTIDALVVVLKGDIVSDGTQVVAEMLSSGWPGSAENPSLFYHQHVPPYVPLGFPLVYHKLEFKARAGLSAYVPVECSIPTLLAPVHGGGFAEDTTPGTPPRRGLRAIVVLI
jgi:hypothetical protein